MEIPAKQIEKLQDIYFQLHGVRINKEVAHEHGRRLLGLMKVIYKPMTHEEMLMIKERREELEKLSNDWITKSSSSDFDSIQYNSSVDP